MLDLINYHVMLWFTVDIYIAISSACEYMEFNYYRKSLGKFMYQIEYD